jgi:N-acetylglutamate synthase-like GNAT family acetyltransferase
MLRFERAKPEDLKMLEALLRENGMEYADPIEDFLLAKQGSEIVGCARMEDYAELAMLRPLVVAKGYRNKGIGRFILEQILPAAKPAVIVARGESARFYSSFGFTHANWQEIPLHQTNECTSCPDRTECRPQPMIYKEVR